MKAIQHLKESEEFTDLYLNHIIEKARASQRRKTKFNSNGHNSRRTHWVNRTGTYRDEELRKGPKYWHGQKPIRTNNPIRTYRDLSAAIGLISSGDKNLSDYRGVSGINRERLRLAQSWRDKGRDYDVSDIIKLSMTEMKVELGFGKPGFGQVYHH